MFGMALTRPSLTMQLTSGVDVFTHVCGQKADTLIKYCDTIQLYGCEWCTATAIFCWQCVCV